jgi:hypothetical protein
MISDGHRNSLARASGLDCSKAGCQRPETVVAACGRLSRSRDCFVECPQSALVQVPSVNAQAFLASLCTEQNLADGLLSHAIRANQRTICPMDFVARRCILGRERVVGMRDQTALELDQRHCAVLDVSFCKCAGLRHAENAFRVLTQQEAQGIDIVRGDKGDLTDFWLSQSDLPVTSLNYTIFVQVVY